MKEKTFKIREALLTTKLEEPDFKSFYNLIIGLLIAIFFKNVLHFYVKTGELHFGEQIFLTHFSNFHYALFCWTLSNIFVFLNYFAFKFWAEKRLKFSQKFVKRWDHLWLILFCLNYLIQLIVTKLLRSYFKLGLASASFYLLEQARLWMKTHSFIRNNVPKVIKYEVNSEKKAPLPKFSNLVYFMFAPVLIYKDEYPRVKEIRWSFVCKSLLQFTLSTYFLGLIVQLYIESNFTDICKQKYKISEIFESIFSDAYHVFLIIFCTFFLIYHSLQNAFAEILRFGDRCFYHDFWTFNSLGDFLRKWNVLVQDWLHVYFYNDIYEHVIPSQNIAGMATVLLSAVVHEILISVVYELFLPLMIVNFFFTFVVFSFLGILDRFNSRVFSFILICGISLQMKFYSLEFYARNNCILFNNTSSFYFFIPRLLFCDCISFQ